MAGFLEDAAHFPGGHATGISFPGSTEEVAAALAGAAAVLPIGAQSSLTGGATPMGEALVSTRRLSRVVGQTPTSITVQAGLTVVEMQSYLASSGSWFPPAPTFTGATAGGIVATNAAGAATFKYGSTRDWVDGLVVVLADGTVLRLERGRHRERDGRFVLDTNSGVVTVPVPSYSMPRVAKRSAGYYAAPRMDLVDLFIGAEGTLGVVTEVTFRILSPAPRHALALVACPSESAALELALAVCATSRRTWALADPCGIDAAAIENMDARSIAIIREDAADVRHQVTFPAGTMAALLIQLELRPGTTAADAYDDVSDALSDASRDGAMARFCRLLNDRGLLDATELALPHERRRIEQLLAIREAVPAGVNRRVGDVKRDVDPRVEKTAADMVVPIDRFAEMMQVYRAGYERRGLDYAIWGHISDGNVHPNVIPRSYADVVSGKEAILEFGGAAARLGGCPLAEHGVGRSAVKQELLRQLYGEAGVAEMRAVKRALDPEWKLAPGVIFSRG